MVIKSHRVIALFLIASLTVLISSACNFKLTHPSPNVDRAFSKNCHTVQHMMGESCITSDPKRLITLYTPALANALALGIKPIGITSVTGNLDQFPEYLKGKVEDIEIVANASDVLNLEKILLLKPDLILGWDHHSQIYSFLSQISPTLLTQPARTTSSTGDWKEYLSFVAKALRRENTAKQLLDHYDRRVEDLKKLIKNRYENEKVSIIHVSTEYGIEVQTKNSFAGTILTDLGLKRPEIQNVATPNGVLDAFSQEKIEAIDGDILFVQSFNKEEDQKLLQRLLEDPLWQKLKAVQQKRVYAVDGWAWTVGNPLAADVVIDDIDRYLINAA
ncbi:ABC transporter substrate-binding protein [Myxacorys almedinensis]|uniref:ABC transporter substrate-binding protein n=1 Tax=Myxacorys almedinensis A TaxID=2690445 RepID=A0A8J7Z611_9CYAN|nr:iron-siderophore ABC transporter substrate-binding protein [Myxacorys almedinensis]NDJ17068.1 ABC transporter substrate-binding protein [Myxacorys almedinensis A]